MQICTDCKTPLGKPTIPGEKQDRYACPKCGLVHYVGKPASVTHGKPRRAPAPKAPARKSARKRSKR